MTRVRNILFGLALTLRLLTIFPMVISPLWYDENFTLLVTHAPTWTRFMQAILGDVHPPLFYMLTWPFGQVHAAPWLIRLPSLIFSIAAMFVLWEVLGHLVSSERVRLAAWTLTVISSNFLYYGTEGRMYALLGLLVLLAVWMMLTRRWAWLAVCTAALLWTHNYGLIYAGVIWICGLVMDRPHWKALTISMAIGGLCYLPWLIVLYGQMSAIHGAYWMLDTFTLPNTIYTFYQSYILPLPAGGKGDLWSQVVFFGWVSFAILWIYRKRDKLFPLRSSVLLFVIAFLPWILTIVGSLVWQPIMLARALTPSIPFLTVLLVLPISAIPPSDRMHQGFLLAALIIVPMLMMNAARVYVPGLVRGKDDAMLLEALRDIEANWTPGDVIVHVGDGTLVDALPYTMHVDAQYKMVPCGLVRGSLTPLTREGLGFQIADLSDFPAGTHIWLITEESPFTPQCEKDLLDPIVKDLTPVGCFRDDPLKKNCVYSVK